MSFFNSGLFWFIEGILACLVVIGLKVRMEDKGILMPVWKWLVFGIWVLLLGFTIAFVFTSLGEREPSAALYGGIIFGVITIVSGVGVWRLLHIKKKQR
ncbi:dehalogenase [Acidobacteriota bacterium]